MATFIELARTAAAGSYTHTHTHTHTHNAQRDLVLFVLFMLIKLLLYSWKCFDECVAMAAALPLLPVTLQRWELLWGVKLGSGQSCYLKSADFPEIGRFEVK